MPPHVPEFIAAPTKRSWVGPVSSLVLVYAVLLLLLNLIVDVGYHFLDRRIKLHE